MLPPSQYTTTTIWQVKVPLEMLPLGWNLERLKAHLPQLFLTSHRPSDQLLRLNKVSEAVNWSLIK